MDLLPLKLETQNTNKLVKFCEELDWIDIPPEVQQAAKRHFLDTMGVVIAGMQRDVAQKVASSLQQIGPEGIRPPGSNIRLTRSDCAYLTGVAAHGLELDDGYRLGSVHPGVVTVPALFASCAGLSISGQRFLEALVTGYETINRLAAACTPQFLRQKGFHPTSIVGPLGAAMAIGKVMSFSDKKLSNALGLAASTSNGLFAFLNGGGDVKRLHAGQAALGGYSSARNAGADISGPPNILDTTSGFFETFGEPEIPSLDSFPPEGHWALLDCYIKPHACCRHIQPAFEALCDICEENKLTEEDILSVDVETYRIAAAHAETEAQDFASAQLSFSYVLALAIKTRTAHLEQFSEDWRIKISNSGLADKFNIQATEDLDRLYPENRPARVVVRTNGSSYEKIAYHAIGGPNLPLSNDQLSEKFIRLVAPVLGEDKCAALLEGLWSIDGLENTDDLFDFL